MDGTRPAMAGLESCCVSVAAAPLGEGSPTMGDVEVGCIVEIKCGASFLAERGGGVELRDGDGRAVDPLLSAQRRTCRGCSGPPASAAARPIPLIEVLGELIDTSSVGGGFFDLGSATFDMTRILTGQLDAYVDVGSADDRRGSGAAPSASSRSEEARCSTTRPTTWPPPSSACEEAGAVVTDAAGRPARRPAAARLGPRVPDVVPGGRRTSSLHSRAAVGSIQDGMRRLLARFT